MPEYKYYQDEKDMVWQRHEFTVTAPSESEADTIIRENGLDRECVTDICDERINHVNSETLFETQSLLMPEENGGKHTLEVLTADKRRSVCTNIDDTHSEIPEKERIKIVETCSVSDSKNVPFSECRPIGNIDGKEHYVLVKFPDVTYKIEEEEIGYPSSNAEDIHARYIPEPDYTRIFGKTPEPNSYYRPVRWPESQKYMPDEEGNGDPAGDSVQALCELINDEKGLTDFGEGAYWVPLCMLR